jgi:hypothetical protein
MLHDDARNFSRATAAVKNVAADTFAIVISKSDIVTIIKPDFSAMRLVPKIHRRYVTWAVVRHIALAFAPRTARTA